MRTLAIDTSNKVLSLALFNNDQLMGSKRMESSNQHSVYAMPLLQELLLEQNVEGQSIESVIVSNGPGSYTGIRIGMTIAKTFAASLKIPLYTISSLQALSIGYEEVITLIDARRQKVYVGHYDKSMPLIDDQLMTYEEAKQYIESKEVKVVSDQSFSLLEEVTGTVNTIEASHYFSILNQLTRAENVHGVVPNYIKPTQAEMDLKK